MTETLIPFLLAVLALLIIPGPDMAFVMANGIAYGRRGAFFSALGISAGRAGSGSRHRTPRGSHVRDKPISSSRAAACWLSLFALRRYAIFPRIGPADACALAPTSGNLFLRGVVTNISNPKALIFFSAFIPQFIPDDATRPALHAFLLGALLCLVGGAVNFAIGASGVLFSDLNRLGFLGRSWSQWIVFMVFVSISVAFTAQAVARG